MLEISYRAGAVATGSGIQLDDREDFTRAMRDLPAGLRLTLTVEEEKDVRTSAANRYLWGVVYKWIENETGQPKESTHAEMCERFLRRQVHYIDKKTGLTVEKWYVTGSSGLTPKQFYEFVENVRLFAAEWHGISIPDPDPEYRQMRAKVFKEAA
jgi:hypothetical protein